MFEKQCLRYNGRLRARNYSPTEHAEFTEPSAGDNLPQIAQIYTDGLSAKDPPTDYTEFTEPSAGEYSPTDCTD